MFDLTLTFDNGPDEDVTPRVLATLACRQIPTTFFVIGRKLQEARLRRLARQARDEGHWIGNHTFSHAAPLGLQDDETVESEIRLTQELMGDLAHEDMLFRPNGGGGVIDQRLFKRAAVRHLQDQRYTCVLWNSVPGDWRDVDGWVDIAIDHCLSQPWTLMVLHDLPTGAMAHLDRFLDRVVDLGAQFRQEFPPDCVPIRRGLVVSPIDPYVSN